MNFFAYTVGLDNPYGNGKIDEGRWLLKELDADPRKVALVGDCTHDFEVARALGIHCILVANGHTSKSRLQRCDAPVLDSLEQVSSIIRSPKE